MVGAAPAPAVVAAVPASAVVPAGGGGPASRNRFLRRPCDVAADVAAAAVVAPAAAVVCALPAAAVVAPVVMLVPLCVVVVLEPAPHFHARIEMRTCSGPAVAQNPHVSTIGSETSCHPLTA